MKKNKELRFNPINLRVADNMEGCTTESRTIAGTAIVFNSQSELLSEDGLRFYETILPEAVTPELIAKSDIVMLYNHKKEAGVLARSKNGGGTLRINITQSGVDFEFDAPYSAIGDNVLESVKRGDLDACSFAFCVKQGGDIWQKVGDVYQRTIKVIEALADFSIVINPAYTATSVSSRGLKEFIEQETNTINEQKEREIKQENERLIALESYYTSLKERVKSL